MLRLYRVVDPKGLILGLYESDGTRFRDFTTPCDWIPLEPDEPILAGIGRYLKWESAETNPLELELCPTSFGEYYPRMYRPVRGYGQETASRNEEDTVRLIAGLGQLVTLVEQLSRLFRVIVPDKRNLKVYGHEIRNVILLACTEVEAQWRGVLSANHYGKPKGHFTRKDYVKISAPLKLSDYQVALPLYPQLRPLAPFATWNDQRSRKSLLWYDAYNAVKHDRENKFSQAKLQYAIDAVVACAVMLKAQYGGIPAWHGHLGNFFRFIHEPTWSEREKYLPPRDAEWVPVEYTF
jgi:hypothetical protein